MKKREVLIIALLLVSLWNNITTLNKVEEQTNQVRDLRFMVEKLTNDLTSVNNQINQMAMEKEWIQKSNFSLVKEGSREDRMVVRGEFTFNEIQANQKPLIFYREKGTTTWAEQKLESLGGLNYAGLITLSPEKRYEYQITAQGDISKGSTILTIPQNVYGYPEKKIGTSMSPSRSSSNSNQHTIVEVFVGFGSAPLEEMSPTKVSLQVESEGKIIRTVPLTNKSGLNSEFGGKWELTEEDKEKMSQDTTKFFIVTEFKNGVILKEKTDTIRLNYGEQVTESKRIIEEIKQ